MAIRIISNTGGNWNATTTWVGGVVPVLGDDVVATATSGQLTINITTAACTSINFTNYTNTFTISSGQTLTVSGNVTFVAAMTVAGTGTLAINTTSTLTSAGKTLTGNLTLSGTSQTFTLAGIWTISGNLTLSGVTSMTLTSNSFNVGGNLTITTTATTLGTTNIVLNGTGTWSHTSNGQLRNNVTINTSGTITFGTNIFYNTGTLTYTAGTVITTGNTITTASGTTTILNTNGSSSPSATTTSSTGINFNNFIAGGNINITSNLCVISTLNSSTNANFTNAGFTIYLNGNLTVSAISGGVTPIIMQGTGTWSGNFAITYPLTINTTGIITISGTVSYNTGTITYINGTVVNTGSQLSLSGNATLNTNGMSWNNIILLLSPITITLTSNLTLDGTLTIGGQATINGNFNIFCGNLTLNNSVSGGGIVPITIAQDIYVYNTLTMGPGPGNSLTISGTNKTIYAYGDINISALTSAATASTATLRIVGTGTFTCVAGYNRLIPLVFDTPGKVVLSGTFNWNGGASGNAAQNITYLRGTIVAKNAILTLGTVAGFVLTNMHKIPWGTVILTSGVTYTMNQFFCGTPNYKTIVQASSTTNYIITFQDNFEKVARFVDIRNATFTRPGQLLLLTRYPANSTNTAGMRYVNQSPNGLAKNNPTVMDPMTYPATGLVQDPNFII